MAYILTVDDDETGDEMLGSPIDDREVAYSIFEMLVAMVTRPGNKREGDLVTVTLWIESTPTDRVVARYERTRTVEQLVIKPQPGGWPVNPKPRTP